MSEPALLRRSNKLTALKVAKTTRPGRYGDGDGLWLQVSPTGTKSWLLRYMLNGRPRQMGLGSVNTFSLSEARTRARACRQLLADGVDPIEARRSKLRAEEERKARSLTFKLAAERYIAAHRSGWKSTKHADQWNATLSTYAFPIVGGLPVDAVDTPHILKILEPIWSEKAETASRVRGRLESIIDWAIARRYRSGDNPARWRGHLDKMLPPRRKVQRVVHMAAMPYDEVPDFLSELRARGSISARALEFTILTAARTSETIGAAWSEIDIRARIWTIPGERMKSGRVHRVPLSARLLEILEDLPGDHQGYVFPGGKPGQGLSNMSMLELLRGMLGAGVTVHGFRSSFRDWAGERTNFPRDVAEAALAHVLKDKTEAAYRRGDALDKRRRLMDAWTNYCSAPRGRANVVVMRPEARNR